MWVRRYAVCSGAVQPMTGPQHQRRVPRTRMPGPSEPIGRGSTVPSLAYSMPPEQPIALLFVIFLDARGWLAGRRNLTVVGHMLVPRRRRMVLPCLPIRPGVLSLCLPVRRRVRRLNAVLKIERLGPEQRLSEPLLPSAAVLLVAWLVWIPVWRRAFRLEPLVARDLLAPLRPAADRDDIVPAGNSTSPESPCVSAFFLFESSAADRRSQLSVFRERSVVCH